ncbi:Peptide deformylase 1A, chloroplastic/mitochondrial [Sarracenia purpurea var. burkii]
MESIQRFTHRLLPIPTPGKFVKTVSDTLFPTNIAVRFHRSRNTLFKPKCSYPERAFDVGLITRRSHRSCSAARTGWFRGLGEKKQILPEIVKAGDPVLHEPARDVPPEEVTSDRIRKIIDDMVVVMRKAPGVGLAAPQIGIPLKIIVLEDTKEYISYAPEEDTKAQDRRPFDLLVVVNPKLKRKGNKTALFFEGCLSVDGFRAMVERSLEVEVTGLDRDGQPIKVDASGWQARILQHECDHLDGTLYVDKMVPRTFRTVKNLDLPLPIGCPKLGVR